MSTTWHPAPFGLSDLEEGAAQRYSKRADGPLVRDAQVRCCIRNCQEWMARRKQGQNDPEAFCPVHAISVSTSPTYVYHNFQRNFIVGLELLHALKKVESWRLGNERSEDALSWNVFVGLARLGGLIAAFERLTGVAPRGDPELYLWGNRVNAGIPCRWDQLSEVRTELEAGLNIQTEPDVILRVPGQAIALIEAKFGSSNGTLKGKEARFGSVMQYLKRYACPKGSPDPLARSWIEQQEPAHVLEQLCRNAIFAQRLAGPGETPFVVNLVLERREQDVQQRFGDHLTNDSPVQFARRSWEELSRLPILASPEASAMRCYLENKTLNLSKAFAI